MTQEEVFNFINMKSVLGTGMYGRETVPFDAIQPVSNPPEKDMECFVVEGKKVWLGKYEGGQFKKINIVCRMISDKLTVVENPDWWISLKSIEYIKD